MRRSARIQSLKRAREESISGNSKRARRSTTKKSDQKLKKKERKGKSRTVAKARKSTRKADCSKAVTKHKLDIKPKNPKRTKKKPKSKKKRKPPLDNASRDIEIKLFGDGYKCVVGTDEAGRGPLAGPVVAAACYVPDHFKGFPKTATGENVVICDSKLMSEEQREIAFEALANHPDIKTTFHVNDNDRIDQINILAASLEAMAESVAKMKEQHGLVADFALIDGPYAPPALKANPNVEVRPVVKGDSKVFAIACASVVAKVTRDRLMMQFDKKFPEFGFAQHKGYPTHQHKLSVFKHGACAIHRLTFAPLKNMTRAQLRVSEGRWTLLQQRLREKEDKKKRKKKNKVQKKK